MRRFSPTLATADETRRTSSVDGGSSLEANESSDSLSWEDPAADEKVDVCGDEVAYREYSRYRVERLLLYEKCPAEVTIICRFALFWFGGCPSDFAGFDSPRSARAHFVVALLICG